MTFNQQSVILSATPADNFVDQLGNVIQRVVLNNNRIKSVETASDKVDSESNEPVEVIFAIPSNVPSQTERMAMSNSDASWIDNHEKFPVNFARGFNSIHDCNTASLSGGPDPYRYLSRTNLLDGDTQPMVPLSRLYKGYTNGPVVDLKPVIELLVSEGFVVHSVHNTGVEYIKYNNKNMPSMSVSLRGNSKRLENIFSGDVTQRFFDKIKEIVSPMLVPRPEQISIFELKGYRMHQGECIGPDFAISSLSASMDYALPEFYPWFNVSMQEYFSEFMASRANVLILIGPPGTGKSTLIRTMIRDLNLRALLAYKPEVISSTYFIKECQNFLQQGDRNHENDANFVARSSAVVVEDADVIMSKRSLGNMQMSEILNATSGIASDNKSKFILSTNLKDIDDIDPALLRPGRAFDILCFRDLTAAEAVVIRAARGLDPVEYDTNRKYKLAEVLNNTATQHLVEPVIKPRFGFISK